MSEPNTGFISCIKVKGVDLLPPVITEERRIELRKYKNAAIQLEKRMQNCRELKKNLQDLFNYQPLSDRPESEVTFRDNSHIESLGISDRALSRNISKRKINLAKEIVDVSEYSDDGIKLINNKEHQYLKEGYHINLNSSSEAYETDTSLNRTIDITSPTPTINQEIENRASDIQICTSNEINNIDNDDKNSANCKFIDAQQKDDKNVTTTPESQIDTPKPRLIRSNSYTLENPSPVLLAHMEKAKSEQRQNSIALQNNWTSMENNYVPFEKSEFSSINTVYHNDQYDDDNNKPSPTIEVVHTDITVQQITLNAENDKNKSALDLSDPNSQLMQVLKNIPEDFSKQILEIINEKQRLERINNVDDSFNNEQNKHLEADYEYFDGGSSIITTTTTSPIDSFVFSVSTKNTTNPSTPMKLIDLEVESDFLDSHRSSNGFQEKHDETISNVTNTKYIRRNGEVSPNLVDSAAAPSKRLRREWAAHIIGAHVKGYLTRRLLRTEKVQSLIETIKDALMCALQLHTAEHIDESDVELHRRLINQVSAACYAFHDIFFSLSTREQMAIISLDRQKRIDKVKRSLQSSSATTPRSSRTPASSRQSSGRRRLSQNSRSLTKI